MSTHIHDVGSGNTCACGWVLRIPPVYVSIEVGQGKAMLVNEGFNCDTLGGAIAGLKRAIDKLERYRDAEAV